MTPPPRTPHQRKQDTLNRLGHDVDAWVATADEDRELMRGGQWLVP
jgi:hypothetical protein